MGASGWTYFTECREGEDVEGALQRLRGEVFAAGAYEANDSLLMADPDLMEQLKALGFGESVMPTLGADGKPATIDDLLLMCAEEGTHSILDIRGTSGKREFAMAFPAPEAWLIGTYGTTRPSREQVEAKSMPEADRLDRWECVYFRVWETRDAEGPAKYWRFEGCSGD